MTGFYVVDDRGSTIGELILWIEDGLPSILEYAWDTDKSADGFPELARVVNESLDRLASSRQRLVCQTNNCATSPLAAAPEAVVREFAGALEPDDIAHLVHALGVMRAALKASD